VNGWPGEPNQPGAPGSGGPSRGGDHADLNLTGDTPYSLLPEEGLPFSSEGGGRQVTVATALARRPGEAAGTGAGATGQTFDEGTSALYRERLTLPRHRDAVSSYFGADDER
jgi:hypothetical protein